MQRLIPYVLSLVLAIVLFGFSVEAQGNVIETELTAEQTERIETAFREILLGSNGVTLTIPRYLVTPHIGIVLNDSEEVRVIQHDPSWYFIGWRDGFRQAYHFYPDRRRVLVFVGSTILDRPMIDEEIERLIHCLQNLRQYRDMDTYQPMPAPSPTLVVSPTSDVD